MPSMLPLASASGRVGSRQREASRREPAGTGTCPLPGSRHPSNDQIKDRDEKQIQHGRHDHSTEDGRAYGVTRRLSGAFGNRERNDPRDKCERVMRVTSMWLPSSWFRSPPATARLALSRAWLAVPVVAAPWRSCYRKPRPGWARARLRSTPGVRPVRKPDCHCNGI
jgi:hypothetical protein